MAIIEGFVILCISGTILLTILGSLCIMEYEFLPIYNVPLKKAGYTCIYAAGIYLVILFLLVIRFRKPKTIFEIDVENESNSSDEDRPFLKLFSKKKKS